jgi:hypothetical protein
MQIDFHHTATYAVARLAGFAHNEASTVAYASQYVDDSTNKGTIHFDNGKTYERIASAHKVFDVANNCVNIEDYQVWVPFHFLPGNNGAPANASHTTQLYQRLLCTPDSPLSQDMWNECRKRKGDANGLHRLGITAHVYCDTFSHQMFAGFRHHVNRVARIEHILPADSGVMERIKSLVADELGLGHGGALTDPDLPYLEWRYTNGLQQDRTVPNPNTFLSASERLFSQFIYFLGRDANITIATSDLGVIQHLIRFNSSEDPTIRHQSWLETIRRGSFSFGGLSDEEFRSLTYIPFGAGSWKSSALGATDERDTSGHIFQYEPTFEDSDWKKFHDALKGHQAEVLNVILPKYELPSSYENAKEMGL